MSKNPAKARRAAQHPDRPGEQCSAPGGAWSPKVDRAKCEGKGDCVEVCPYGVFEVGRLEPAELAQMSFVVRIKMRVHGNKTARVVKADACKACGLCVVACPEKALSLVVVA